MWHVSSRSGVATLRTAIHLLLTYLLQLINVSYKTFVSLATAQLARPHSRPDLGILVLITASHLTFFNITMSEICGYIHDFYCLKYPKVRYVVYTKQVT